MNANEPAPKQQQAERPAVPTPDQAPRDEGAAASLGRAIGEVVTVPSKGPPHPLPPPLPDEPED